MAARNNDVTECFEICPSAFVVEDVKQSTVDNDVEFRCEFIEHECILDGKADAGL